MLDGPSGVPLFQLDLSKITVGVPKVRSVVNGELKVANGLVHVALPGQKTGEVIVCVSIERINLQGLAKCVRSFVLFLLPYQKQAVIVMCLIEIGIQSDGTAVMLFSFVEITQFKISGKQVCVRLRQLGIVLKRSIELANRLVWVSLF